MPQGAAGSSMLLFLSLLTLSGAWLASADSQIHPRGGRHQDRYRSSPVRLTVLVPPDDQLRIIMLAYKNGDLSREQIKSILELHFLTQDYTVEQLLQQNNTMLYTLPNTLQTSLRLTNTTPPYPPGPTPVFSYANESVKIVLEESDIVHCSKDMYSKVVYHRIDGVLSPSDLSSFERDFAGASELSTETSNEETSSGSSNKGSLGRREATETTQNKHRIVLNKAFALVMFVVVYMVLFGATVFVLRTLWRHGLCGGGARSAQDSDDAPKERFRQLQERKLYRWDLHLWSPEPKPPPNPPQTPSSRTDTSTVAVSAAAVEAVTDGDLPHSSSSQDLSQAEGGDSCGLKADHACVICFENEGDHVFLKCGHGGYCSTCAYKLLIGTSALCPVCRAALSAVGRVPLDTPVGEARVVCAYACMNANIDANGNAINSTSETTSAPNTSNTAANGEVGSVPEGSVEATTAERENTLIGSAHQRVEMSDLSHRGNESTSTLAQAGAGAGGVGVDLPAPSTGEVPDRVQRVDSTAIAGGYDPEARTRGSYDFGSVWANGPVGPDAAIWRALREDAESQTVCGAPQLPPSPHSRMLSMIDPGLPPAALPPPALPPAAAAVAAATAAAAAEVSEPEAVSVAEPATAAAPCSSTVCEAATPPTQGAIDQPPTHASSTPVDTGWYPSLEYGLVPPVDISVGVVTYFVDAESDSSAVSLENENEMFATGNSSGGSSEI